MDMRTRAAEPLPQPRPWPPSPDFLWHEGLFTERDRSMFRLMLHEGLANESEIARWWALAYRFGFRDIIEVSEVPA